MNTRIIIFFFISCLFLNGCQKDIDLFIENNDQPKGPDTIWYSEIKSSMPVSTLLNNLLIDPYKAEITMDSNDSVVLSNGLRCYFPPYCCIDKNGQLVTGKVNAEVLMIKNKGDLIRMNKPSISFEKLLVNDISVFIQLKKDGQDLQLVPGKQILITYPILSPNPLIEFFTGHEYSYPDFSWMTNPDPLNNTITIEPNLYKISTNQFKWISLSGFYNISDIHRTKVSVDIPSNFTNANTIIFAVFKDFNSVVAMEGNFSEKKFSSEAFPLYKSVTLVAISKQGVDYYLGYQNFITKEGSGNGQTVAINPVKKSFSDITYFLSTL